MKGDVSCQEVTCTGPKEILRFAYVEEYVIGMKKIGYS